MAYSLDDKITSYLENHGVTGARLLDAVIVLPLEKGEMHRRITGVITSEKLDSLIEEYRRVAA